MKFYILAYIKCWIGEPNSIESMKFGRGILKSIPGKEYAIFCMHYDSGFHNTNFACFSKRGKELEVKRRLQ